jgi:hypothetical protein
LTAILGLHATECVLKERNKSWSAIFFPQIAFLRDFTN